MAKLRKKYVNYKFDDIKTLQPANQSKISNKLKKGCQNCLSRQFF